MCVSHLTSFSVFLAIFHVLLCEFLLFLDLSVLAIFQVLQCAIFIFQFFQCFSPYSSSYSVYVSISTFLSFLNETQGTTVCIAQYFTYSTVSRHISVSTVCVSHFAHFSVFLPQSSSYTVCFSYLKFFTVSYHNPCPTVYVSHFTHFSVFLTIFHVLLCDFLLFLDVSLLAIFQERQCAIFIFHFFPIFLAIFQVMQCFFSFSTFFNFLAKI